MNISHYATLVQRSIRAVDASAESYVIVMKDGTRLVKGDINPKVENQRIRKLRRPLGTNQLLAHPFIDDIEPGEVKVIPWDQLHAVFGEDTREQIRNLISASAVKKWGVGNCMTTAQSPNGLEIMNATIK